jgi:hypothetical protein
VFCYTSWRFYAFSGTNLLTRCHSASSLFSIVFVFQKNYIGNILRIGWNKSWSSYFSWHETESKAETEGGQRAATPCHGMGHPLTSPSRLYILLDEKTLGAQTLFQKTYCKPPPSSMWDQEGPEALPGTPAGEGNHHRRPSSSPCMPSEWCVSSLPWTMGP